MQISIVMPTYNGMAYLEQAVNSVLAQTNQDWELLISDDGSKDETRSFLATLSDPRIKIYLQPKNLGIFGNLNFLFTLASCERTQILCQDDYFTDEGSLDRLLDQWSKLPPEIAFLRCNHLSQVSSNHERFEEGVLPSIVKPESSDLFFFIFGCIPGNLSNVCVRTEAIKQAGWFRTDLPYAGDFEFWSRVGHSSSWAIAKTKVAHIRGHGEQASKTLNRQGELLPQVRRILDRLYQNLASKGYPPTLLRFEATVNYISQHRYIGIKALIKGKGTLYIRRVSTELDSSDFAVGTFMGWLIFFATLGGRIFTTTVAKQLLKINLPASSAPPRSYVR